MKKVTKSEEIFLQNIVAGKSQTESYRIAFANKTGSYENIKNKAYLKFNKPNLQERYEQIVKEIGYILQSKTAIDREKMLEYALEMLGVTMGIVGKKVTAKKTYSYKTKTTEDMSEEEQGNIPLDATDIEVKNTEFQEKVVYEVDVKSFTPLWKEINTLLDFYPKADTDNSNEKLNEFINKLSGKL